MAGRQRPTVGQESVGACPGRCLLCQCRPGLEIAIKKALGKLSAPDDLAQALATNRFEPPSISVAHALTAGALPRYHEDPFDRLLLAQAQVEDLTLLTHDVRLKRYGVPLLIA